MVLAGTCTLLKICYCSAELSGASLQVQSGVGRTGKWWGHEHFAECRPDMLLFAKGIASGFPMAGVAATGEIYENLTAGMLVSMGRTLDPKPLDISSAVF